MCRFLETQQRRQEALEFLNQVEILSKKLRGWRHD